MHYIHSEFPTISNVHTRLARQMSIRASTSSASDTIRNGSDLLDGRLGDDLRPTLSTDLF